jgi:dolichol-phosphate mannosyltransferase
VAGFILLILSLYMIGWIFINTFQVLPTIHVDSAFFDDRFSQAIGLVFQKRPHAFFVGGITLILAIQILSLGFISLQNKRYFEESFHINSTILKALKKTHSTDSGDSLIFIKEKIKEE